MTIGPASQSVLEREERHTGVALEVSVVSCVSADPLRQRRLAALARAVNEHRRKIADCLSQPIGGEAWIQVGCRHRLIARFVVG
jgi:hypothetical protein